jgi:hypothetical protein
LICINDASGAWGSYIGVRSQSRLRQTIVAQDQIEASSWLKATAAADLTRWSGSADILRARQRASTVAAL